MHNRYLVDRRLPWDGTYIGCYSTDNIISQLQWKNNWYVKLQLGESGHIIMGILKKFSNIFPILVDEMKTVFGLEKMGTHLLIIDKVRYIIYRIPHRQSGLKGEFTIEPTLKEFPLGDITKEMYNSIQENLVFRDLLGIASTFERNILIRGNISISTREISCTASKHSSILPREIINKWFTETTIPEVARRMVRYHTYESPSQVISIYRDKIEIIINKIDKEWIWYSGMIIDKLVSRILDF